MQPGKLTNICKSVMGFLNRSTETIGKSVGFIKRRSKLNAGNFCRILIASCLSDNNPSLEGMCRLAKEKGIRITKQGLQKRFTSKATLLMQELFTKALQQFKAEHHAVFDLLADFTSVGMIDSSSIALPSNLKDIFKGWGGTASAAGLKLQTYFDYTQGQIKAVDITPANINDQKFDSYLDQVEKGSLHLQDLGYFKKSSFKKINDKGAYFISRFFPKTALNDAENKPISLLEELRKCQSNRYCKEVSFDIKNDFKMRLIAFRLPNNGIEKRIKKIKRNAAIKGRMVSQETLELSKWSIFITNIPIHFLSDDQVYMIYTLRWQIELFFKLCKSNAGVDRTHGKKADRIVCEIYAKLICIVILLFFSSQLRWDKTTEISFQKAYKQFKSRALDFFRSLSSRYLLLKFIKNLVDDLKSFAYKDRYRRKRRLACQNLLDSTGQVGLRGALYA
jgi:hypothetical protein